MKNLNVLLHKTRQVLESISLLPFLDDFTLVGGSALAIYLNYRLSEDLDFFTCNAKLDAETIRNILTSLPLDIQWLAIGETQIDCSVDGVKLTLFAKNWRDLKNSYPVLNYLKIAPLSMLGAMKVNTLFLRAKKRDYFVVYAIYKSGFSLEMLFEVSASTFPGVTRKLFATAPLFIEDIEDEGIDYLKPNQKITLKEIEAYFRLALQQYRV